MSLSRVLALAVLPAFLLPACSSGNEAGAFGGDMFVVSCSLGCLNGSAGDQIFCSINSTFQNQEISILFSEPIDFSSVNASSFRVVNVAVGTSPIGSFLADPLNPRRLVFRPSLSFDANGNPLFGFEPNTSYQITIPGTAQGDNPPFIRSVSGRANQARVECTIETNQGIIDPVPGPPSVSVTATIVTDYDTNGDPITFLDDQAVASPELIDVSRNSQLKFFFNDVMNPASLANPVTKESAFIEVLTDGDGDLTTANDRVPVAGDYEVNVDQDLLTTMMTFTPAVGYPSAGPVGVPPGRRIVVSIPTDVIDLDANPVTPDNGGGLLSFFPERINFSPVVLPVPGGETFVDQSLEDASQSSAFWGNGRLAPGTGGGSGRLGALIIGQGETLVLDTDSQTFPIGASPPDFLGNLGMDGTYPGQLGGMFSSFTVEGGLFEFSKIVLDNGAVLSFTGSNPPRLFSRGPIVIASGARIDLAGTSPGPHDSTIAFPEMGMRVIGDCTGSTTSPIAWLLDTVPLQVGVGGPTAGGGGFGGDRHDFNGNIAMFVYCGGQFEEFHDPLDFGQFVDGMGMPFTLTPDLNGRDGLGVGNALNGTRGLGGLKFPDAYPPSILTMTSMAFPTDIAFNEVDAIANGVAVTECVSRQIGGPGSGGGYATPGGDGVPLGDPQFADWPMGDPNNGPTTPGGTMLPALVSEPPNENNSGYVVRRLEGTNLRGGAGGGGAGNHPWGTYSNGLQMATPGPCISNSALLREWHDHSGAAGGGGGGAIGLVSGRRIDIDGIIDASGGDGGSPYTSKQAADADVGPFGLFAAPGGAGAGGAIKLQSIEIAISGAPGRINVSGGQGGFGIFANSSGGDGGAGLVRIEDLDGGLTPTEARALLAPSILPFEAADNSLGWFSADPGGWDPSGSRPESITASVSCWMKPDGNFFSLDFDADMGTMAADQGWNVNVLYQPSAGGEIFTVPFRGDDPNPLGPLSDSWENTFGNSIRDGLDPSVNASPIAIRFQGAQLVEAASNLCNVPLTGIDSPVLSGSVTPWVTRPEELNNFVPKPNMIRFAVVFDGTLDGADNPGAILDAVVGVSGLFIDASPN